MLYQKLFVHLSMTWIITRELNLFCNPEEIFDFFWQALLVCGLVRFRIFQGYSLFSYQCSLLFSVALIYYHNHLYLSTTFLFCFASFWSGLLSLTCDSLLIITNHNSFVNIFFDKKLHSLNEILNSTSMLNLVFLSS